jgi:hypothetical protein
LRFPDKGLESMRELENRTHECWLSIGDCARLGLPNRGSVPSLSVLSSLKNRIRDMSSLHHLQIRFSRRRSFKEKV